MKLSTLLDRLFIKSIRGDTEIEISSMETDSRKVTSGGLFICLTGSNTDGHLYIEKAISNGAAAILAEREAPVPPSVTLIRVPDTRRAMAILADYFYGQCSHQLKLIGVTGTNGKTTTTHLIEKMLTDYRSTTGLIGTLHMKIGDYSEETVNTTPEAVELQKYFRLMLDRGAQYAVLEVSSHALDMGRIRGCCFRTAVFMNLTHDHLDYHHTMEQYLDSKSLLFSQLGNTYTDEPRFAILNADDPAAPLLAKKTSAQVLTFGIGNKADVQARNIRMSPAGTFCTVDTFVGPVDLHLKLPGRFNIYNVLAALTVGLSESIPLAQIKRSLEAFEGVPGRFQPVYAGQSFSLIIDYAHNPDGLEHVLRTARELTKGKVTCVVGCEGDRDVYKRPIMAEIAVKLSDKAILTSDNPRSEDPDAIIRDMTCGLTSKNISSDRYIAITDRKEAIRHAMELAAGTEDCVIITGKGHETRQIFRNGSVPFNDKEIATAFIHATAAEPSAAMELPANIIVHERHNEGLSPRSW